MALNKTLAHLYFIASHVFLPLLKGVKVSALSGRYNLGSSHWKDSVILEKCWVGGGGGLVAVSRNCSGDFFKSLKVQLEKTANRV